MFLTNIRDVAKSGGALAVSVYVPYLLWNMTGIDMEIKSKSFLRQADIVSYRIKPSRPQNTQVDKSEQSCMFSYDTDDRRNRALIRVGQSGWSTPLSFEVVGQSFEAIIPWDREDDTGEAHLGITIDHGLGPCKLTKIVTIRPRFIVESFLDDAIYFRQPGAKEYSILEPGAKKDIIFLSNQVARLSLRFGDSTRNKWYQASRRG